MANVLADLAIESEAATVVALRLAGATDRAARGDRQEAAFRRLALAVTKYHVCKQAPGHAAEALECLGGNGYVEESGLPRLYREAPLQSIWEGSGNVAALDAIRALAREPQAAEAFFAELDAAAGADRRLDEAIARLRKDVADPAEATARRLAESMAVVLQGALLIRHGEPAVADAFVATRLAGDGGRAYGTLPPGRRQRDLRRAGVQPSDGAAWASRRAMARFRRGRRLRPPRPVAIRTPSASAITGGDARAPADASAVWSNGAMTPKPRSAEYFDGWYADKSTAPQVADIMNRNLGLPPDAQAGSCPRWRSTRSPRELRLKPGDVLLDLACGRAWYGLEITARDRCQAHRGRLLGRGGASGRQQARGAATAMTPNSRPVT